MEESYSGGSIDLGVSRPAMLNPVKLYVRTGDKTEGQTVFSFRFDGNLTWRAYN
jgi:hypothetical protein